MEIGQWQLELAGVMQCNINPANRGFSVATEETKERIKRMLDWQADAQLTKGYVSAWLLEWIGRKPHSRQARIQIRADIFEISKYRQVFVTQIVREGTVECLAVSRRKC